MTASAVGPSTELAIKAVAGDVRRASAWLGQIGDARGVPADQIARLDLCLNEALANVISHGGHQALVVPVLLRMEVNNAEDLCQASVTVIDSGPAFDSASAPMGARPTTLEDAVPGGLGRLMILNFSDDLVYRHVDGCNELTFSVRWGNT